jgi:hypothetical protein
MRTFIGIDPGKKGGIAVIRDDVAVAYKIRDTLGDNRDLFEQISEYSNSFCLIEDVHAMPGNSPNSMFSFGKNFGMLLTFLSSNYIAFETVTPQVWQKEFGLLTSQLKETTGKREFTKTEKKRCHYEKAQELFPHIKMTHALADALLIAEFNRRNA